MPSIVNSQGIRSLAAVLGSSAGRRLADRAEFVASGLELNLSSQAILAELQGKDRLEPEETERLTVTLAGPRQMVTAVSGFAFVVEEELAIPVYETVPGTSGGDPAISAFAERRERIRMLRSVLTSHLRECAQRLLEPNQDQDSQGRPRRPADIERETEQMWDTLRALLEELAARFIGAPCERRARVALQAPTLRDGLERAGLVIALLGGQETTGPVPLAQLAKLPRNT